MAFYDKFPYTNFQEINLDKLIIKMLQLELEQKEFINNNVIKYANPIGWDITTQYEANTVVTDSKGNAYISSQPVPAGVNITNTDYWSKIGNFEQLYADIKNAITPADEGAGTTASAPRAVDDLVWVGDDLLKVTAPMIAGDTYVIGSNCIETNMDVELKRIASEMDTLTDHVDESVTNLTTYVDQSVTNLTEQVDQDLADMRSYIESSIEALPEFPTPEVFGAKGDGITDDTAAFIALVNHCKESKVKCYIPNNTYQLSQNILFDSSLIVSNGGNFPAKKIFTNGTHTADFDYNVLQKAITIDDLQGSYSGYYLQACCMNPITGYLVIGLSNDDTGLLVEVDDTFTVIRRVFGNFGHINDMTYNAIRQTLFLAPGGQGANANRLIEVDPTTLSIIGTFDLDYPTAPKWHVAYDPKSESLIASSYVMQWFIDAETMTVYAITNIQYKQNKNVQEVMQNSFIYKDKLYTISFPLSGYTDFYFVTYDYVNESWDHVETLQGFHNGFEIEGVYEKNNKMYALASDAEQVYQMELFDRSEVTAYVFDDVNKAGKVLSDENLDTLFGTGVYACRNSTIANQLGGNVPFGKRRGFNMTVETIAWRATKQTATVAEGTRLYRTYDPDTGVWSHWFLDRPLYFRVASAAITGGTYHDFSITFPDPLDYQPTAMVSLVSTTENTSFGYLAPVVRSESTTGVTVRVFNSSSRELQPGLRIWVI